MRRNEITTRKRTSNRIPGAKAALLLICLMAALAFQQVFQAHAQSTGIPTITGTAKAGAPLKADTSAISDPEGISDGAFTYQWVLSDQVADTDIPGADGPHYIPWDGDIGKRLKVRVSYTDDANNQEGPLTSAASHTVARNPAGPVIWSGTVTAANLGNMRHGYSTVPGDLGGSISDATLTYRGSTFTIVRVRTADSNGDEGFNFDIETSNEGGNHLGWTIIASDAPAASRSTINAWRNGYLHFIKNNNDHHWTDGHKAAVALRINNPRTYGLPRITGDATIGQILTADPKGIIDRNGLPSSTDNFTYQWMRWTGETLPDIPGAAQHYLDSRPIPHEVIPGATRKTYVPTADELGRTIKVRVSYTDGDGFREGPLTSTATPEVVNPTGAGSVATPEMLPAPQMFSVEKTNQTAAVLRWSPHQDAEEYRLEKKKAGQEEWARIPYITPNLGEEPNHGRLSASASNLDCNTTYDFRITARKKGYRGFGPISTAQGTTGICPKPFTVTKLELRQSGNCAILTWTRATSDEVNGYRIARSTPGEEEEAILVENGQSTLDTYRDCSDGYRTPDARHVYWIAAIHGNGKLLPRTYYTSLVTYEAQEQTHEASTQEAANNAATGKPTINGTPKVRDTLTADTSQIADADGMNDAAPSYQWAAAGANIPGENASTYIAQTKDAGKKITVTVSFTDDAGNQESVTSDAAAAVAPNVPGVPSHLNVSSHSQSALDANWQEPSDNGGARVTAYTVQWKEETGDWDTEADVSEETSTATSHTIGNLTNGTRYSVRVIATNSAGDSNPSSTATGTPEEATDNPLTGFTLVDTSTQTALATLSDGNTVTLDDPGGGSYGIRADTGSGTEIGSVQMELTGQQTVSRTENIKPYSLHGDDGTNLHGQALPAGGYTIRATAHSGSSQTGDELGSLEASFTVEKTPNSPATGAPTISGAARVGETLMADTSGIADENGLGNFSYQWVRVDGSNEADISGATGATYELADADQGKTIQVQISFTDNAGNAESLTSTPTSTVEARATPLTVAIENPSSTHDGSSLFTFEVRFSEETQLSYVTLRDHAFTVTGGEVQKAQRLDKPSNILWRISVEPSSNGEVEIQLPTTNNCSAQGSICTQDGRKLSNALNFTVSGPDG